MPSWAEPTGGLSSDAFVFSSALDAVSNADTIKEFSAANDAMQLDDGVFAGIGSAGALSASAFHVGIVATDAAQRIIYDDASGNLFFDADGMGGVDQVLFARLQPGLSLTSGDFVVF